MKKEDRRIEEEREWRKNKIILLTGLALGITAFLAYAIINLISGSNVDYTFKIIKNGFLLGIFVDIIVTFFIFEFLDNNKKNP